MNEKFFELRKEKQDRMINGALKVFSQYGYHHASTDEIVREAGISKGLLFHYFENKIGLYTFLYDYSTRFVSLELSANVDRNESGYFPLYSQILAAKADTMSQYPFIFPFLDKAEDETDPDALEAIREMRSKYQGNLKELRDRADVTTLKSGVDYLKLWDILDYTVKGLLLRRIRSENYRADLFKQEADEYVEMMRRISEIQ